MTKKAYFFIINFLIILLSHLHFKIAEAYEDILTSHLTEINAITAVVLDGTTGKVLYAKNPDLKIPPASTVKLITAMVVLDKLNPSQKVVISKTAAETPSVSPYLYEGEVYTVRDLLYLSLMKSSNQAAVALAEAVAGSEEAFATLMNKKALELNLKNSYFVSASGLPHPGQYTTAYELAIVMYEALKYPLIKEIINTPVKIITSQNNRILVIKNTNKLLEDEEIKDMILGGKTGFTRASRHCLVNAVKLKDRLLIISLLGVPNREALWNDSKNLIKFANLVLDGKAKPVYFTTVVYSHLLTSDQKLGSPYKKLAKKIKLSKKTKADKKLAKSKTSYKKVARVSSSKSKIVAEKDKKTIKSKVIAKSKKTVKRAS